MLVCWVCVVPLVFALRVAGLWPAVALVGLAAAAHQGWSANAFTLVSDMFPRRAVASVVGIGGFGGGGSRGLVSRLPRFLRQHTRPYVARVFLGGTADLLPPVVVPP